MEAERRRMDAEKAVAERLEQERIEKLRQEQLEAIRKENAEKLKPDLERVAAWGEYLATNLIDPPHLTDSELTGFVLKRYDEINDIVQEIIRKGEA